MSTMSSTASSVFVQSLKDPTIVMLRAKFKAHHKAIDEKSKEIDCQIINVQKAKDDGMPTEMIRKYSGKLDAVITEGEDKLKQFTLVQDELNTQLEYLTMLNEDDPVARQPVEAMKERMRSQFSPFKTRFATRREESRHLLEYLFDKEPPAQQVLPQTTMINQRKDYSYLRPRTLNFDCTKKELAKFIQDSTVWISKALSEEDRSDPRLVWASIRSTLDEEWADLLGRDGAARDLDTIHSKMNLSFIDRNPLIVQRLNALRIQKSSEESISETLRKIKEAYESAELQNCPLETLSLLHLVTLLPSDVLSEKVKTHIVESLRITPNITSLEEILTYILSQEADDIAKKNTQQASRVSHVTVEKEDERKKIDCRVCGKTHPRFRCTIKCEHCRKPGHRIENCWTKHPNQAPPHLRALPQQGQALPSTQGREQTPGVRKGRRQRDRSGSRKSDRGSSFERSQSEPESPAPKAHRKRHRSNRIIAHHPPAGTPGAAQTLFGSSQASSGSLLFPEEPRVNRILRLNRAGDRSYQEKVSKHGSLQSRKLTREILLDASDIEYNLDGLFETDDHLQSVRSPPFGGEDTLNLEELFAWAENPDRHTVLEMGQFSMESEVNSHLENESLLTGGEGTYNLELLFGASSSPKVGGENGTAPELDSEPSFGTSVSPHQAEFRDGKIERTASEFDVETDQAAGDTCHHPGWVDLPQHTGVVVDLSKTTLQSSRRTLKKESVKESVEDRAQMALEMTDTDKALPDEAGEPRSTLRSAMLLVLMLALGTVFRGQETEYTGRHDLNMSAASSKAEFAEFDRSENLKTEHILLNNSGKILPSSVVQTGMMELDPEIASQRMTDMLAALMIMLVSVILGLTIGLLIVLAWRYWREMRVLVSATVDLVYLVANIVRGLGQREVEHDNPPTEDEDVGEEPDEDREQVRSYHCCGEIPNHEGICDSSDADTAQLDMNDESSDSEDSSNVVVTDPAGKRYVVRQLPRGMKPVGIVRPH